VESKSRTVYAGDYNNDQLLVIHKDKEKPYYVDLEHSPISAILMKDDIFLIIGCYIGFLNIFNLETPVLPTLIK
jgi:hypothetical protein